MLWTPNKPIFETKNVPHKIGPWKFRYRGQIALFGPLEACLPIVDVPVHIVTGMPMTVGMGMPMAITMGTKKHIIGIAHGYSHGHAHYILAVPMTLSMGTLEIRNFVFSYHTSRMESYHYIVRPIVDNH